MLATTITVLISLGFFGFGIYILMVGDTRFSVIVFLLAIFITTLLATSTSIFNPSGLYLSQESRQQFEDQLREITSEETIKVSKYNYALQGELDMQIGTSLYVVDYETIEGIPTVNTIRYGNDVRYDRGGIEWNNEPNTVNKEE